MTPRTPIVSSGQPSATSAAVEHQRRVVAAAARVEPAHDRVAADLLLAVRHDRHVALQLALAREVDERREQAVEVALVVRRAAGVDVAVAHLRLERRRVPGLERRDGLHVVVPVDQQVRCAGAGRTRRVPTASGFFAVSSDARPSRPRRGRASQTHSAARRRSAASPSPDEMDGIRMNVEELRRAARQSCAALGYSPAQGRKTARSHGPADHTRHRIRRRRRSRARRAAPRRRRDTPSRAGSARPRARPCARRSRCCRCCSPRCTRCAPTATGRRCRSLVEDDDAARELAEAVVAFRPDAQVGYLPHRGAAWGSPLIPPPHLVGERARALDVLAAGGIVVGLRRGAGGADRRARLAHRAGAGGASATSSSATSCSRRWSSPATSASAARSTSAARCPPAATWSTCSRRPAASRSGSSCSATRSSACRRSRRSRSGRCATSAASRSTRPRSCSTSTARHRSPTPTTASRSRPGSSRWRRSCSPPAR